MTKGEKSSRAVTAVTESVSVNTNRNPSIITCANFLSLRQSHFKFSRNKDSTIGRTLSPHDHRIPVGLEVFLYITISYKTLSFFQVCDLNMAMSFKDALSRLENSRVKSTRPLIPPQILQEDLPL